MDKRFKIYTVSLVVLILGATCIGVALAIAFGQF